MMLFWKPVKYLCSLETITPVEPVLNLMDDHIVRIRESKVPGANWALFGTDYALRPRRE